MFYWLAACPLLPVVAGGQPFELAAQSSFGSRIHPIDEEDTVKVVNFVLHRSCKQSFGFEFNRRTVKIQGAYPDVRSAGNVRSDIRKAEAAFGAGFYLPARFDLRINQV